jgi:opacity protein-like surface antigen
MKSNLAISNSADGKPLFTKLHVNRMVVHNILIAVALTVIVLVAVQPATAQITFQKWDMYAGYSYLNTPTNDMSQYGYNLSFGRNINHWLALGMDYSNFRGSGAQAATGTEMAAKLPASVLQGLPPGVAQLLPGVTLNVPLGASTSTFAAGTQFQVRKTKWVTPFFRPFLGAFHSRAEGNPSQITPLVLPTGVTPQMLGAILATIPQDVLKKAVTQSDTCLGYGVGAGMDFNVSRPIGIRFATDYIRTSLFDKKQNNVRIAFGLIYRFGPEMRT